MTSYADLSLRVGLDKEQIDCTGATPPQIIPVFDLTVEDRETGRTAEEDSPDVAKLQNVRGEQNMSRTQGRRPRAPTAAYGSRRRATKILAVRIGVGATANDEERVHERLVNPGVRVAPVRGKLHGMRTIRRYSNRKPYDTLNKRGKQSYALRILGPCMRFLALTAISLSFIGCSEGLGGRCKDNSNCSSGLICNDGASGNGTCEYPKAAGTSTSDASATQDQAGAESVTFALNSEVGSEYDVVPAMDAAAVDGDAVGPDAARPVF